jgi:hypothetical protein
MPWGEERMATDRDEQLRQKRELEEIRRSFAEMGARMGSLFEPAEPEEDDRSELTGTPTRPALPAPPAADPAAPPAPSPLMVAAWPRWGLALAAVALILVGLLGGYLLFGGDGGSTASAAPPRATASTQAPATIPPATQVRTRTSVPETCVEAARLADTVIARLNRNIRDERLFLALRDYTIASQACRREASP